MKAEQFPLITDHGGYRNLRSFQIAQLVYDLTVRFCDRYIDKRSRTHDQMVQAARSGVQNIAEGSQASGTSKKTELKLTNVARSSLEEPRLDYEDFLRQRDLPLWGKEDLWRTHLVACRCKTADDVARWAKHVHDQWDGQDGQYEQNRQMISKRDMSISSIKSIPSIPSTKPTFPEIAANAAHVLIGVACALLDRQLSAQAKVFENEGGFTERLYRVRSSNRRNKP